MGFRHDTRHLSSQVQQIIRKRDENDKLLKESRKKQVQTSSRSVYNTAIFMKLGFDITGNFNGIETLKVYEEFCDKNKSVWFSTDSLAYGMSEEKRQDFLLAIQKGYIVEMYFAVSKNSDKYNDIVYRGEIIDISTDSEGISSPDKNLTPAEWRNIKNKIWIRLKNVKPFDNLSSDDFVVVSTGNVLSNAISKSQYHFGYIKKK